jgi:hypothetical protein
MANHRVNGVTPEIRTTLSAKNYAVRSAADDMPKKREQMTYGK